MPARRLRLPTGAVAEHARCGSAHSAAHARRGEKLLQRLESISSLVDLEHMQQRIHALLGLEIRITPGNNEVRTMRGIQIDLGDLPGLCRKTRQSIPAAIRKGLERKPEIAWALLDAHDLFGMPGN